MDTRIKQFLSAENITQSQLANTIGVGKSNISHIISGRNKPSFDFIEAMSRCYPELNLDWLISGRGKMYKTPGAEMASIPTQENRPNKESDYLFPIDGCDEADYTQNGSETPADQSVKAITASNQPAARISKVIVFYEDGTFREV